MAGGFGAYARPVLPWIVILRRSHLAATGHVFWRAAFEAVGGFNVNNRSCWDGELLVDMVRRGAQVKYLNRDLALFRIHAKSITGSRRHSEMMKADAERMFSLSRGRRWTALDTLRGYLFRIERILTHPGAVESAIRARMRRI